MRRWRRPAIGAGDGPREGLTRQGAEDSPTRNASGLIEAGRIFYRALTTYLNPLAGYGSATLAAQAAAVDLYGFGSQEHKAAVEGFAAVGLPFTPIISCPPQLRVLYYICSATVGLSDQGPSADQAKSPTRGASR